MKTYRVTVPATSANIGCGFDSFGVALSLSNTVIFHEDSSLDIELETRDDRIPLDESNMIYSSALYTAEKFSRPLPTVHLFQQDHIPFSSGMGSSAACIVAGILIADTLLDLRLSDEQKLEIATELEGHPDNVSPAIFGGFCITINSDSGLRVTRIPVKDDLKLVICHPHQTISTEEARKVLPCSYDMHDVVSNIARGALLIHSLHSGDYSVLKDSLADRIHQPFRKKLITDYEVIERSSYEAGALGICISGAGPSVLIFSDEDHLQTILSALGKADSAIGFDVYTLSVDNHGATVSEMP